MNNLMQELIWLYGKPHASGVIKQTPEDFIVIEDLGYEPDGEGEHVLVKLRKTGCNTQFVAQQLAKFAGIPARAVSYAGLKDRHAVTEQWFCLHLPGKKELDFSAFNQDGCEIVTAARHRRKLRIGNLKGNAFQLTIRDISDREVTEQRLQHIMKNGVPNYFGEQRFGRNGDNLAQAAKWANNEIKVSDRQKRSFYLSAVRSALFNIITSNRIANGLIDQILPGDVLQLAGKGSWFIAEKEELDILQHRLAHKEIFITAPLPGGNDLSSKQEALAFEKSQLIGYENLIALLCRERLESARRSMLVVLQRLSWQWIDDNTLILKFNLPSGSFATSVVRELITIPADQSIRVSD